MRFLSLVFAVGCSHGSSDPPPPGIDAAPLIDAACIAEPCNPLTQAGCTGTQRCTWIVDDQLLGHGRVACASSGPLAQGQACTRDTGGADPCARGTTCLAGTCRVICALQTPVCDATLTCRSSALFQPCGITAPLAGLCVP